MLIKEKLSNSLISIFLKFSHLRSNSLLFGGRDLSPITIIRMTIRHKYLYFL